VQRVFEPFFTSHAGGEHVGLGLSVSYGIIERHGGTIEIENLPAGGACVTVRLPSAFVGRDTLAVARA
jgi:signal transduction histidine kinase